MTGDFYECPKCGWRARLSDVDIRTRCSCGRMVQLPAATAPNPRAWAVATALAAESGLDWAAWARGETADPRPATWWCTRCEREGRPDFGQHTPTWSTRAYCRVCIDEFIDPTMKAAGNPVPVPASWDADAYRADCARRGVEPGPMPSLKYTSPDGRIDWGWLHGAARAYIRVAGLTAEPWAKGWDVRGCGTAEDLALLSRLATAAKRAMGGP